MTEQEMVTRAQARKILGLSTSSLQRYEKKKELTVHRTGPGRRLVSYPLEEVMRIKNGAANAPSDIDPRFAKDGVQAGEDRGAT
jgi:hypothetical protein